MGRKTSCFSINNRKSKGIAFTDLGIAFWALRSRIWVLLSQIWALCSVRRVHGSGRLLSLDLADFGSGMEENDKDARRSRIPENATENLSENSMNRDLARGRDEQTEIVAD
ncbi:unnamed protein product [Citrullus colocynthis]|uniref:Uncharacterized protein n=1 Tax=Citrullus colocynthis TaxID=252529 RepID=A0ABP0Y927_9ROSI